ncbi:MAG: carboxypeptidase M32 [Pseudomonadota bacterium]|nr:carboxypeptidase M32 [Pseudomonadota bacterium]MEE3069510.1 carboxypeptidase M32 [Pseudomonadota bacterium]
MAAYDDLMAFVRVTEALGQVAGRTGWDQEVMMPEGAAEQRAEEMAALEQVLHARRCEPRVGEWLAQAEASDAVQAAQLREIRRSYDRATKVPSALAEALARTTSKAQGGWAKARGAQDVAAFLPILSEVVQLRREEAAALGGDVAYDALLDDYEPGLTGAEISDLFDAMRPRLVALRDEVLGRPKGPELKGSFDPAIQMALAEEVALAFGYDLSRGRIDKAVHPFSSGSGQDVRITTRTAADDPFNCIYSTIHEVGHACYEQNISDDFLLTPLGSGASMGVHESQSRIYENQLGRSRAFTGWLYGRMVDRFGALEGIADEEAFYRAVNRVHNGYIRTEADEVQYNLHVMLRFDLERALFSGQLEVSDLEAAWNDRFKADFGYAVDKPSNGVLQDVHWSVGLFGYFPTYTLGNVYAGCLHDALRKDLPDLEGQLANGDLKPATGWLREKVQRFGSQKPAQQTIEDAIGGAVSSGPLLDYLDAKFTA